MSRADAICVYAHVGVLQFAGVVVVQGIAQTIAELQFRDQFEEWQVEITAQAHLQEHVRPFQLNIFLILARQIDHRVHACHDVGAVVVPALRTELQVNGEGDIGVLHVLCLFKKSAVLGTIRHITERQVLGSEVHGWRESQVQVLAQPQIGQHTHAEAAIPSVCITEDGLLLRASVFMCDSLRSDVVKLNVLHVHSHQDAKVQWAQVDIWLVLDLTRLSLTDNRQEKQ